MVDCFLATRLAFFLLVCLVIGHAVAQSREREGFYNQTNLAGLTVRPTIEISFLIGSVTCSCRIGFVLGVWLPLEDI